MRDTYLGSAPIQVSVLVTTMYPCKVDVDMVNATKSVLADVSSVSPSSLL